MGRHPAVRTPAPAVLGCRWSWVSRSPSPSARARAPTSGSSSCDRSITGMAIEVVHLADSAPVTRPPDVLARRLLEAGATKVTIYSNVVTVEAPAPNAGPSSSPRRRTRSSTSSSSTATTPAGRLQARGMEPPESRRSSRNHRVIHHIGVFARTSKRPDAFYHTGSDTRWASSWGTDGRRRGVLARSLRHSVALVGAHTRPDAPTIGFHLAFTRPGPRPCGRRRLLSGRDRAGSAVAARAARSGPSTGRIPRS